MPVVQFARSLHVAVPPPIAWEKLTDPHLVASWVGLVDNVEEVEHLGRYSAVLTDRLGPFRLSADLSIAVTDVEEPSRITFNADGEDRQVASRIQVEAAMTITPKGAGSTIEVEGRYEVTGRVATLGASMIRTKGNKVLDEFFAAAAGDLG